METVLSDIINEPTTPKWLRYTITVIMHLMLWVLFSLIFVRCVRLGMLAGWLFFGALILLTVGTFAFTMLRIHKGRPDP